MGIGIVVIVIVVIALITIGFFGTLIGIYNSLVKVKNDIKKSWSNINVLLKQRSDELPKLIASVKGYMKHEKGVLTEVTNARTAIMGAKTIDQKAKADNMLSGALKSLFAVAENYPTLKANENFMQLQSRITGLENELADRREFYNDTVNTYNIRIASFPDMIVAGFMHLKEQEMFKVAEEDKKDVKVEF
ncbi:LemA family protein [archaeon]|jgi:LemA protein|nr:LemA family protein [archaeon]MBT4352827.1 LemA family protein [archaeon]MBT4647592.1 LemA family protein [archaeon]MBT6820855.1 LemA family protein [archaeon]